ncbi:hypothetical protein [Methylocystis sp.]|uniref:hypothetical protein n=1 Tax=Methylocystis sp. TaxID=1911079 RepID=UPI0025D425CC|nr:hypothetical protein [Methylocystis sp.]
MSAQPPPILQFVSVEIMPTGDGRLAVSLAGTYLDEELLEFVNDEIASARVASLDDALAMIRNTVAAALGLGAKKEGH